MEKQGVKAIATSCGFLAIFYQELVNAVHIPVFSSSLLKVHLAQAMIRNDQKVEIFTAYAQSLSERHFASVGIDQYPKAVIGMETVQEFTDVFIEGKRDIDIDKCRREMVEAALQLIDTHTAVGAIILECTNMPPYARDIQTVLQLPLFDVVTLINYAYTAVVQQSFLQSLLP